MLIRFSTNPIRQITGIVRYNFVSILFFIAISTAVCVLYEVLEFKNIILPVVPVTILGGGLAIFLGFRNNSAYDRWWEARKIWGGIVNDSRSFGMEVMSLISEKFKPDFVSKEEVHDIQKDLIYRHVAWLYALKSMLRQQPYEDEELEQFVSKEELESLKKLKNIPAQIITNQGIKLQAAYDKGATEDFRHIELLQNLKNFYTLQGKCERIKNTVFPFYYTYFTRVFLWLFIILLPFALVEKMSWFCIPMSVSISFVFAILEKSGEITEDPFEDRAADIPMTTLVRNIEIDMRQQLGEEVVPDPVPKQETVYGALFVK